MLKLVREIKRNKANLLLIICGLCVYFLGMAVGVTDNFLRNLLETHPEATLAVFGGLLAIGGTFLSLLGIGEWKRTPGYQNLTHKQGENIISRGGDR